MQVCNAFKVGVATSKKPFRPTQRLHNKAQFDRVYRAGKRSSDAMFAVFVLDSGSQMPRLGLSTAARIVGNSVQRNRIKRLVRESFRECQHELPKVDIVVNARSGVCQADNPSIRRSLDRHWQTVTRKCAPC